MELGLGLGLYDPSAWQCGFVLLREGQEKLRTHQNRVESALVNDNIEGAISELQLAHIHFLPCKTEGVVSDLCPT